MLGPPPSPHVVSGTLSVTPRESSWVCVPMSALQGILGGWPHQPFFSIPLSFSCSHGGCGRKHGGPAGEKVGLQLTLSWPRPVSSASQGLPAPPTPRAVQVTGEDWKCAPGRVAGRLGGGCPDTPQAWSWWRPGGSQVEVQLERGPPRGPA